MQNNENVTEIERAIIGRRIIQTEMFARLYKNNIHYIEIDEFVYRITFDKENFVTIMKVYPPDSKTVWQIVMPFEIEKVKTIIKTLNK